MLDPGGTGAIPNRGVVKIIFGVPGDPNDPEERREKIIVTKRPLTKVEIIKINEANKKRKSLGFFR